MLLVAPSPPAPPLTHLPRAMALTSHPATPVNLFMAPRVIPERIPTSDHELPSEIGTGIPSLVGDSGMFAGLPNSIGTAASPKVRVVSPKLAISSGVMDGHKLSGAAPRYPGIAIAAQLQGTVVLAATITRAGKIENLRVVSGSPMLAPAAAEAVRTWRYRPYLLNGEPIEVETTVQVIFHLSK
jgi:protein TonB